jgi:hypothetical protein
MSQGANVRSIQAIRDFKAFLATFAEDARNALSSSEMEIRRTRNWLTRDQLSYWQGQIKRRNEQLAMARTELHRRRLSQQGSDAVSDTEQKEAVRLAQRRLAEAEEKLAQVKRWVPILEHAISEYHSASQPLGDRLSGTLVNSLALLERMVMTLEAYVATQAPSTEFVMGDALPGAAAPAVAASTSATESDASEDVEVVAEPAEKSEPEGAGKPEPSPQGVNP